MEPILVAMEKAIKGAGAELEDGLEVISLARVSA
jgi:hypothetical protein